MTAIAIDNFAALGVEEISTATAEHVDGGGPWSEIIGGIIANVIYDLFSDPDGAAKAFMTGFNATAS